MKNSSRGIYVTDVVCGALSVTDFNATCCDDDAGVDVISGCVGVGG